MRQLLTQADLDDLPEDPQTRFIAIHELCTGRFDEAMKGVPNDEQWRARQLERRYASILLASGKALEIEAIASLRMPDVFNGNEDEFGDFIHNVEHVVTQIMHGNSLRKYRNSIELHGSTKDRLFALAQLMREHVERLDLPDARKDALIEHVNRFILELSKRRLSIAAIGVLLMHVTLAAGEIAEGGTALLHLGQEMFTAYAHAQQEQDRERARQLPRGDATPTLLIASNNASPPPLSRPVSESYSADLEDEIPF